jgi:hypothetical protein
LGKFSEDFRQKTERENRVWRFRSGRNPEQKTGSCRQRKTYQRQTRKGYQKDLYFT